MIWQLDIVILFIIVLCALAAITEGPSQFSHTAWRIQFLNVPSLDGNGRSGCRIY
jgi:uncharacterized integral membrane protein